MEESKRKKKREKSKESTGKNKLWRVALSGHYKVIGTMSFTVHARTLSSKLLL